MRGKRARVVIVGIVTALVGCGLDTIGVPQSDDAANDGGARDGAAYDAVASDAPSSFDGAIEGSVDGGPQTYAQIVAADGPAHWWRFEEPGGASSVADIGVPGAHPGTPLNGVGLGQASASAALGHAAHFDGVDTPGTRVEVSAFHVGTAVTVECWVNLAAALTAKSFHSIVARWDGSYEIDVNGTTGFANFVVYSDAGGPFVLVQSTQAFTSVAWHHLVGVYAGGNATIWLDGVQGETKPLAGSLRDAGPTPDHVLVGATRSGSGASAFNFTGWIDEVAIYPRGLANADVQRHYTAGK